MANAINARLHASKRFMRKSSRCHAPTLHVRPCWHNKRRVPILFSPFRSAHASPHSSVSRLRTRNECAMEIGVDIKAGTNAMRSMVVGVIGNTHLIDNRYAVQVTGERNLRAVAEVTGALPLIF